MRAALWSLQEIKAGAASPALKNMVTAALLITVGLSLARKAEGAHFQLRFTERAASKPHHTYLTLDHARQIVADVTSSYFGEFISDAPRRHAVMSTGNCVTVCVEASILDLLEKDQDGFRVYFN